MDLFYTAEWMARQEQDHSLPMQKKLKLKPVEEDGTVFKMFDGDTEKALIDLHDRNPGEVFKARIRNNGNTFNIIDDSEDSSSIHLRGNGTVLEANCRGWLGHRICLKHEGKEFQVLQNPLTGVLRCWKKTERNSAVSGLSPFFPTTIGSNCLRIFLFP